VPCAYDAGLAACSIRSERYATLRRLCGRKQCKPWLSCPSPSRCCGWRCARASGAGAQVYVRACVRVRAAVCARTRVHALVCVCVRARVACACDLRLRGDAHELGLRDDSDGVGASAVPYRRCAVERRRPHLQRTSRS
jgi:hypothetical protein